MDLTVTIAGVKFPALSRVDQRVANHAVTPSAARSPLA